MPNREYMTEFYTVWCPELDIGEDEGKRFNAWKYTAVGAVIAWMEQHEISAAEFPVGAGQLERIVYARLNHDGLALRYRVSGESSPLYYAREERA